MTNAEINCLDQAIGSALSQIKDIELRSTGTGWVATGTRGERKVRATDKTTQGALVALSGIDVR